MLDDVIKRLEVSAGPNRELDFTIKAMLSWPKGGWQIVSLGRGALEYDWQWVILRPTVDKYVVKYTDAPFYTSSIDAALKLVPEGWTHLRFEQTGETWGCFLGPLEVLAPIAAPESERGQPMRGERDQCYPNHRAFRPTKNHPLGVVWVAICGFSKRNYTFHPKFTELLATEQQAVRYHDSCFFSIPQRSCPFKKLRFINIARGKISPGNLLPGGKR